MSMEKIKVFYKDDPEEFCNHLAQNLSGAICDIEAADGHADKISQKTIMETIATLYDMGGNGTAELHYFRLGQKL